MAQISIFDGNNEFKFEKPIRLIELFAGYGSQHLALKYLRINVESHRICEWAVKSIQAYKDLHFGNDNTDYSAEKSKEWLIDYLFNKGISADYNKPMTREQIARMGETKIRTVYNNIIATNNLVSVCNVTGEDLAIKDTDRFTYLLTYSFPCQDLSKAGHGKGMEKGSGTRSGLLWEVERLLDECETLPQVLLMENVPDVIGTKNVQHFASWLSKLDSLGYKNFWQVLNGKDYGIPQNRERCFMVSVLGDFYYEFPSTIPLKTRLKDYLEKEVDEKYYLSQQIIDYFVQHTEESKAKGNGFRFAPTDGDCVAKAITTRAGGRMDDNFIVDSCIQLGSLSGGKWDRMHEQSRRFYSTEGLSPTSPTSCGGQHEPKIFEPFAIDEQNQYFRSDGRVRKLTPRECFRLMGVKDEDFDKIAKNQSNSSLYHLAGDSIITDVLKAIFKNMI